LCEKPSPSGEGVSHLFRDAWRAPGWTNKLRYVFGNPGWRHEPGPGPTFGARQPT